MEQFDQLMRNAQGNIADRNYQKALDLIEKAELLLRQSKEENIIQWAYVFDFKRFCLYELKQKDLAQEVCREALAKLNVSADWAYLSEYNIVRSAKRSALNLLAWEIQEKAQSEQEIEEAVQCIDECFRTISPIEDKSVFNQFYDTRALVYEKAAQFNPQKYRSAFFRTLHELEKSGVNFQDQTLSSWLQNKDYLEYKNNDPLEQLKLGKENETWQEALQRYEKVFEIIKPDVRDEFFLQTNKITYKGKESLSRIEEYEKKYNCAIPESLKKLYVETGPFSVKDGECFNAIEIYSDKDNRYAMQNIGQLVTAIDTLWGGRPEFQENFSAEQIQFLNENYFVFGHVFHDDNTYSHLYFDRQGNFGKLIYDQDDFYTASEYYFTPLLKKSIADLTLDRLISVCVDEAIEGLLNDFRDL